MLVCIFIDPFTMTNGRKSLDFILDTFYSFFVEQSQTLLNLWNWWVNPYSFLVI